MIAWWWLVPAFVLGAAAMLGLVLHLIGRVPR
jgi:hypothetical protein